METIRFDTLEPYLLLKNGNFLYKVPFRGGWAVLKVYYGSRSRMSTLVKSAENVVLAGQTSYMPKTRLRVERECMQVWRSHGFRVYQEYPNVEVLAPNCPPGGYMLMEYLSAPKLDATLRDTGKPLDARLAMYRRFLQEWGRRHAIAVEQCDPRLVHENGDGKHVMILDNGEFLWFDFEMIFRSPRTVAQHISHEIIQYLWYLMKNTAPDVQARLLEETARHYPSRERLVTAYEYFFLHPNLLHRWGRAMDRRFKKRGRRPDSKYAVALQLKKNLDSL
jgi:hypothetical protein